MHNICVFVVANTCTRFYIPYSQMFSVSMYTSIKLVNFADNTTLEGLVTNSDESNSAIK